MHIVREMPRPNRRLDSWKEIATFFGRDERTVKRWGKERSLPVHRLPGSPRARVFAFTDELSRWMNSQESAIPEAAAAEQDSATAPARVASGLAVPDRGIPDRHGRPWIAVAALVLLVTAGLVLVYRRQSLAVTSPRGTTAYGSAASLRPAKTLVARPANPEAQELYLKGRYYWDKRTPGDLNKAVDLFTQSIVRDPNYAQAYVGLANCYSLLREYAAMPSEEAFPRAFAAAKKAVELDESSAEAHNSLALVSFYWKWDVAGAEREFRRAIELDPNYATAHHWYATFLMTLGRYPEAIEQIERAQQLDPGSTPILADKALILFHQGNKDDAIALLRQIEKTQPTFFSTHEYLAHIYQADRDYPHYLQEARKSAALSHDEHELAILHAAEKGFHSGGGEEMLRSILRMQKKFFDEGAMPAFLVASTYAQLGDKAETLRYLQTSYQRHETEFVSIRTYEPFSLLRDDAAFRNLLAQAGLPSLP